MGVDAVAGVPRQGAGHRRQPDRLGPIVAGAQRQPCARADGLCDRHHAGPGTRCGAGAAAAVQPDRGPQLHHLQADIAVCLDSADLRVVRPGRRRQSDLPVAGGVGARGRQHLRRHPQYAGLAAGSGPRRPRPRSSRASTWR
ncbi:hypothetical protein G6F57_021899 [Rhizopus arrhizus]|nr:hypothetical protein G6F57_021899 [Rhizopus arrhizus]